MYKGIVHAFRYIYVEEGVRGFYRGVVPSVVQIMPYMGLMFGSFDAFKRGIEWLKVSGVSSVQKLRKSVCAITLHALTQTIALQERNHFPTTNSTVEDTLCGALAGIFSKTGVFPMDVVRKRLQVQGPHRKDCVIANVPRYSGPMFLCIHQIIKHEGFFALYKGLVPGIVKAAPASAVTFLVYGKTREVLERWREEREKKREGV
ncbi:mitochondrial carrier domain-containing protein, partial [Jimgerdemannia flammicorona]